MTVETLHDTFVYHLEQMYYVENRLVDVLDQFASDVANDELRTGLREHREQTREHVNRLEKIFETIDEEPYERSSAVFDALLEEREEFLANASEDEDMRDLHDLGAAAKNEHMEIAGYENLLMLSRKLDHPRHVRDLLEQTLDEEQETKKQLRALGEDSAVRGLFARLAG